ncbi:hypothetical protein ZWY2020_012093 [Hordeum vulgare]|nr:hypothetical protein ZWY2020_012093 [Hordeum vulgare]
MAIHIGTRACARKPGSAVSRKHKFYFSCQSYGVHSRACEVYVWEDELEEYVQKRICAAGVKLQELREDRDEFIEELSDRTREIRKLKRMNKVLQLALASTAPVAAMIAVTAAWAGHHWKMVSGSSSGDYRPTDEESIGGFDVYPTHHMDEDEDSESEEDRCGKRKGSQNPINSRSSIKKMKGLVDRLCEQKRYIREELLSSAGRVKSELLGGKLKSNLSGCTFFLQVFYLDNLDREEKNLAHNVFPRCKEYNQKTIADIIDEDTSTGKDAEIVVYGHLLPRKPGTVCYSRNSSARQGIDEYDIGCNTQRRTVDGVFTEFAGIIINKVEQFSNKCQTIQRSTLGKKRKKVTTSKRHTPNRARMDISDESEGAQEAAHKAIDDFLEAANDFSMAHSDGIGHETTQLAEQKGNKQMCSAQQGHGPHNVEENEMDNMEENQLTIVPVRNQNDEGVGGTIDPADMHSKFKVALTGFRKTDLMSALTAASSSTCMSLGMQLVRTPVPNQLLAGSTSRTSPVSLHRQMCAVELDIREEIEEGAINLNVNMSQGAFSTQPQPKRIVKPGKYARSPFVMGYDPPTRAPANVMQIYKLFYRDNTNKLKDMWIISQNPKYKDISGQQLRDMLRDSGEVDNVLITLTMRRYQQMDIAFAAAKGEGCWRHFLEPDFVNHVSREDDISMLRYIKDMFVGPHITYEVNKCTEIVLPVKFDFKWSTYIWDFPKAKIFVLDPTMNNGDESDKEIQLRHRKVADELHKAIELCIKSFFAGWEPDMRLWNTCFPKSLVTGICKKY